MLWHPLKPPFADFKKTVFQKAGAVSNFIFQIGEYPALRMPSEKVSFDSITSNEFKEKIKYLKECLIKYRGLTGYGRGITAVQTGIPERFSIIYTPEESIVIINPIITKKSEKLLTYPEMCMSASPMIVPTIRPSWIEFDYYNEQGDLQHWTMKDDTDQGKMMNRIFQHEIDHMNGIINVDAVRDPRAIILESDPNFYKDAKFEEIT